MSDLREQRLTIIRQAADRIGLTLQPDVRPLPCFDDSLLLRQWPKDRSPRAVGLYCDHLLSGGSDSRIDFEVLPTDRRSRVDRLLNLRSVVIDTRHCGEDEFAEAAAAGCRVFGFFGEWDRPGLTVLQPHDFLTPILESLENPKVRLSRRERPINVTNAHLVEEVRRDVMGKSSATIAAICNSTLDISAFEKHCESTERARDMYMFGGERLIMFALIQSLPDSIPGAVIEIGVGSGGTFSVLTAFCKNPKDHHIYAYDDFSYSADQQEADFWKTMEPWRDRITSVMRHRSEHAGLREPIAFLHVDGNHDYLPATLDLEKFATQVVPGGLLICDDVMTREDQAQCHQAVMEFVARGGWQPVAAGAKIAAWRRC